MRDRGTKCCKTHPKDPVVHKRPTTSSVPSLIQEHYWGASSEMMIQNPYTMPGLGSP